MRGFVERDVLAMVLPVPAILVHPASDGPTPYIHHVADLDRRLHLRAMLIAMAKAKYQGPADRLEFYERLVASVEDVERKGAANPYTSQNGYMTSFIDRVGEVSLRLSKADQAEFIETYQTRVPVQYGKNMPDFAIVPDDLLERLDELRPWFVRSWEFVGTLDPK
jgi:hypothetical protein